MKTKLKLNKLLGVLPKSSGEALQRYLEGFSVGGDELEVKRLAVIMEPATIDAERAAEGYVSTRDVDHEGEVLDPGGAVLDIYLQNPVVLWAHDYSQPPHARTESIKSDGYGLKARRVYAETERAEEIWQLVKGGFIRTTSVGFVALKRVWKGDEDWAPTCARLNAKWGTDLEAAGARCITTKWVLLEYSDVPIPANPYALNTAVGKALNLSAEIKAQLGVDESDAEEEAECQSAAEPVEAEESLSPNPSPEAASEDAEPSEPVVEEPVVAGPIVTRYVPQETTEESEPTPTSVDPATIVVVTPVKAAPPIVVSQIQPAPTQEQMIARVARETLDQLRGRV